MTYRGKTVDLPAGIRPQIKYIICLILSDDCQVSRLFSAEEPNSRVTSSCSLFLSTAQK